MQSQSFTKLFSSITDSSLWDEPDHVRIVWITLLTMADAHGFVYASIPGLAARARKTVREVEEALEVFRRPDPYSRTKDHEGRRLIDTDGGWYLLNYAKHRKALSVESARESKRAWAARHRASLRQGSTVERVEEGRDLPSASLSASDQDLDPEGVQGEPTEPEPAHEQAERTVYRNLDGWEMSPELRAEAIAAGVPPEDLDRRVAELRNGPIGGRRGVFDRDDYVRSQFPKWRTWAETERHKARSSGASSPGGTSARTRCGSAWEPNGKHRAFAQKHALDLDDLVRRYVESGAVERRTRVEANEDFGKRLGLVAKGKGLMLDGGAP